MPVTAVVRTNLDLIETLRVAKGIGIGATPDEYPVLRVGSGAGASVSVSGTMAIRYNAGAAEVSVNGGAWGAFGALPNVGPGAALYGGAGVASVTLDAQGRVTALATATYALASALASYMPTTWTLTASGGLTGGGTGAADRSVSIATAGVTSAMLRDSAALSVLGRSANSTGVPADIAAGTDGLYLHQVSGVLGFSAILDAELPGTIMRTSAISVATGQVAYATAPNVIGGAASMTFNPVATFGPGIDAPTTVPLLTLAGRININTPTLFYTSGSAFANLIDVAFNPASGDAALQALRIQYTVNRAANTGSSIGLRILCTETNKGSGPNSMLYASSGAAVFAVESSGGLILQGGSTAFSYSGSGGLRYNEATNKLQWAQHGSVWANLDAFGGAPVSATYITATSDATLTNEFALGSLATGLLKNTITTGIPTIAVAGTDFLAPSAISILSTRVAYATATNVIGGSAGFNFDSANTRLGLGQPTPLYALDIAGSAATQIRFGSSTADNGGYLLSTGPNHVYVCAGVAFNGSNWIAKSSQAAMFGMSEGQLVFFSNVGLTAGNSYSPTQRGAMDTAGNWRFGDASFAVSERLESSNAVFATGPRVATSGSGIVMDYTSSIGRLAAASWGDTYRALQIQASSLEIQIQTTGSPVTHAIFDVSNGIYRQVFTRGNSQLRFEGGSAGTPDTLANHKIILFADATIAKNYSLGIEGSYMWFNSNGGFKFYDNAVLKYEFGSQNVGLFGAGSYGGGDRVVFLRNRTTAPWSNPSGGGILFAESGALHWRGSSGTVTVLAPA